MIRKLALFSVVISVLGLFSSVFADEATQVMQSTYFYSNPDAVKLLGSTPASSDLQAAVLDGRIPSVRVQLVRSKSSSPKKSWEYSFSFESVTRSQNAKTGQKTVYNKIRNNVVSGSDEDKESASAKSTTAKLLSLHKKPGSNFVAMSNLTFDGMVQGLEKDQEDVELRENYNETSETQKNSKKRK